MVEAWVKRDDDVAADISWQVLQRQPPIDKVL